MSYRVERFTFSPAIIDDFDCSPPSPERESLTQSEKRIFIRKTALSERKNNKPEP
jgi:hypothetical protein